MHLAVSRQYVKGFISYFVLVLMYGMFKKINKLVYSRTTYRLLICEVCLKTMQSFLLEHT